MALRSQDDLRKEFLLEEFKALRLEIDSRVRETRIVETGAVASIAAIYAWLSNVTPDTPLVAVGWWIPVGLTVAGAFRYFALIRRLMHIAEYMGELLDRR